MRRTLLAASVVLSTLLVPELASAEQDAPAPTPSASTPPAPSPPAPQAEFVPDPSTQPTPHWYGWQPAIFDGVAALQAVIGYATDVPALYATGGLTYLGGPLGVHLYHGRSGNIVVGAALRLATPGVGAATGFVIEKASTGGRADGSTGTLVGVGVGCVIAAVVDDVFNSREMLQFWERETSMTISPIVSRDTRGLSLVGSF